MTFYETGICIMVALFLYDRLRVKTYYTPVTAVEM